MADLKKYTEIFKKNKYLLLVLIAGIVLLLIPTGNSDKKVEAQPEKLEFSIEEWEDKAENVLKECDGVGRVKVALSVLGTTESVYAEEEKVNTQKNESNYTSDSDKKISVLSGGSGIQQPVLVKQMYPAFLGATVVCDGADLIEVRAAVTEIMSALTGLSTDKISIVKMKQ